MRKVFKYGTGDEIPKGAEYLYSCKNGILNPPNEQINYGYPKDYKYVWHYFLVDVDEDGNLIESEHAR